MESKQHATQQPMGQQRKQKESLKKKTLETNENGNTTAQTLKGAAKAVLRGKLIVR